MEKIIKHKRTAQFTQQLKSLFVSLLHKTILVMLFLAVLKFLADAKRIITVHSEIQLFFEPQMCFNFALIALFILAEISFSEADKSVITKLVKAYYH